MFCSRYVFTPTTGTQVNSLEQLNTGHKYVCDSLPKLKKLDYEKIKESKPVVVRELKPLTNNNNNNNNNSFLSQHGGEDEEVPINLRPKVRMSYDIYFGDTNIFKS